MHIIDKRYVARFIRNASRIQYELDMFLQYGDGASLYENLDVMVSKDNHSMEKQVVNRITDKDYMFKTLCLDYIVTYFGSIPMYERDILIDRYKKNRTVDQIVFDHHSSRTVIYSLLKKHMTNMLDNFVSIYEDVYMKEDDVNE